VKTNKCINCDAHNNLNAKRCYNCGYNLEKEGKIIEFIVLIFVAYGLIHYMFN